MVIFRVHIPRVLMFICYWSSAYSATFCCCAFHHTHTRARTHTHARTHTRMHAHTRTHTRTHTRMQARTHAHTRTHTHARTHTNAHTYTHLPIRSQTFSHSTLLCFVPRRSGPRLRGLRGGIRLRNIRRRGVGRRRRWIISTQGRYWLPNRCRRRQEKKFRQAGWSSWKRRQTERFCHAEHTRGNRWQEEKFRATGYSYDHRRQTEK